MVTLIEAIQARNGKIILQGTSEIEKEIENFGVEVSPRGIIEAADYIQNRINPDLEFNMGIYLGIITAYRTQQIKEGRAEAVSGLFEGIKYVYGIENLPRALRTTIILVD